VALVLAGTGEKLWLGFAPKYLQTLARAFSSSACSTHCKRSSARLCVPRRLADGSLGQRRSLMLFSALSLRLHVGAGVAPLAGAPARHISVSGLERVCRCRRPSPSSPLRSQHANTPWGSGCNRWCARSMMVGPLVGGWLITRWAGPGVQHACCSAFAGPVTMAFQCSCLSRAKGKPPQRLSLPDELLCGYALFHPALRELLISDILIRFCERIRTPCHLWAMNHAGVDAQQLAYWSLRNGHRHGLLHPVAHWPTSMAASLRAGDVRVLTSSP